MKSPSSFSSENACVSPSLRRQMQLIPRDLFAVKDLKFQGTTLKAKLKNRSNSNALSDVGSLMSLVAKGQLSPKKQGNGRNLTTRQRAHGWW